MATEFPFDTYPLEDSTRIADDLNISREVMDDGTPAVRILGASVYRKINFAFIPMTQTDAQSLIDYIVTNRATEFEFSGAGLGSSTYTGYIWSDAFVENFEGVMARVSIDVYARRD
jgi:hypothetical protein